MDEPRDGWDVLVIRHGTLATRRSAAFHESAGVEDGPQTLDYYAWVVRHDGEVVCVVDLGFSDAEARHRGRTRVRDLRGTLRSLGVDETWSGAVILTHLHYDHTGLIGHLPRAVFHVGAGEVAHWLAESRSDGLESADDLAALRAAAAQGRVIEVHGDTRLRPGIDLLSAPGHTPGQLMVRVGTATSPGVLIASDAAHFDEEYARDRPFHAMDDLRAAARTYARIRGCRDRGDVVLTGHEAGITQREETFADDPEIAIVRVPRDATATDREDTPE